MRVKGQAAAPRSGDGERRFSFPSNAFRPVDFARGGQPFCDYAFIRLIRPIAVRQIGEDVFRGFQQLNRDHQKDPVQAHGVLRNDFRLHLTPGRDTDRLFLLKEGDKIDLLQRATVSRAASSAPPPPLLQASASSSAEKSEEKQDANDAAKEDETEYKGKEQPAAAPVPAAKPAPAAYTADPLETKRSSAHHGW